MADISLIAGGITVHLTAVERMLSLHGGDIHADRGQISSVRAVDDVYDNLRGMRMPGTGIPSLLALGTWRGHDAAGHVINDFALIHARGPGVVIDLHDHAYSRLLVTTDDAVALAQALGR